MGKYLPKKGKVHENYECRKARVIFVGLSLFWQIFAHINHKLIKKKAFIIFPQNSSSTKTSKTQQVVSDFRHGENVHSDR